MQMNFPLYLINHPTDITTEGDVTFCRGMVLDDKSVDGKTLSERRLKLMAAGTQLYPLHRSVDSHGDLVKLSTGGEHGKHTYIDVYGKVVKYIKRGMCTIITKPIAETVVCSVDGSVHIRRQGETIFMRVRRKPDPEECYAIAAITGGGLLFMGYSKVPLKDTKLMV